MAHQSGQIDAIIIGAGHNGLVAAGYLARAGKKVVVLEQRDRVGGACTLEEPFPGFTMSPCAYVVSLLRPEIIRDLELHRYGFDAYIKDPQMFVPYPDGNYLFFRARTEKTIEGIRRLSAHDAEAYPEFLHFFDRASEILNPILLEEPPSVSDLAARFQGKDEEIYRYLMFGNLYDMLAEKVGKISPRENATEKRLARSIQSHSLINPAYREVKTGGGSYACGLWPERPGIRFPH